MFYFAAKVLISAVLIAVISEVSRRHLWLGAILASIPLVSALAILWLYIDTHDVEHVIALSRGIFLMVLPSLLFFITLPYLLERKINFYLGMGLAIMIMMVGYFLMMMVLKKIGIKIC